MDTELCRRIKLEGYNALVESHCQVAENLALQMQINERLTAVAAKHAARIAALEAAVADLARPGLHQIAQQQTNARLTAALEQQDARLTTLWLALADLTASASRVVGSGGW